MSEPRLAQKPDRKSGRIRQSCARAVQNAGQAIDRANDPRVTAILRWSAGICAPIMCAGVLAIIGLLVSLRDQSIRQNQQLTEIIRVNNDQDKANERQDIASDKLREEFVDVRARVRALEARGGLR